MISQVSVVCIKVYKLIHFLSVATDSIYLHNQTCGTHWYVLVLSLYLELSMDTFSEPNLKTLSFVIFLYMSVGLIKCFKFNDTLSRILYNSNNVSFY